MKITAWFISLLLLLIAMSFSCERERIEPSGQVATLTPDIEDFDALSVFDDFKVFVTFADAEEVRLEVDDNVLDRVRVEKDGSTLLIKLDGFISFSDDLTLEAFITVPYLRSIKGAGDAEIFLENELNHPEVVVDLTGDSKLYGPIQTPELRVELSGDSRMELSDYLEAVDVRFDFSSDSKFEGAFECTDFRANLRGDSEALLSGLAINADITASGDSKIEDFEFSVQRLDIDLKSDSEAKLTVTESIDVRASGDSVLEYKGNATINSQDLSGDSKVIKVD